MATSESPAGRVVSSSPPSTGANSARLIPLPVIAAAAIGFVILGFFGGRRRGGRKTGGGSGRHPALGNRRSSEGGAASSAEGGGGRHGGRPASLAELRAARASAAESRIKNGGMGGRSVGTASRTPLGCAIVVCRKVDGLEEDATKLIACVKDKGSMDDKMKKEQAMLIELLMQAQLELDGIKGDESVRPLKKVQTKRMHSVIQELEKLSDISPDPPKGGGNKASSIDMRPPSGTS